MLVVVQEQERNPPGRRRGLLIGNSKGRLFCIAPDEEQRVGFASGAWWSYLGGVEVWTATIAVAVASVAAAVRRTFVSDQKRRTFDAHPVAGCRWGGRGARG
jgi:hypothetical protein